MLPLTFNDVSVPTAVICDCVLLTLKVVPVNVNPVPALYVPAPLNCANIIGSVPIMIVSPGPEPTAVSTQPVPANVSPS